MTTGYVVTARGDLDVLFRPRVNTAAANVNFKSNGGVDLSQRFEPRGSVAAIANTNFLSAGVDLAQIFMDGAFAYLMLAATTSSLTGFSDGSVYTDITGDSFVPTAIPGSIFTVSALFTGPPGPRLVLKHASTTPPNADTSWQSLSIYGKFSDNPTVFETRTALRSTSVYTSGSAGGFVYGDWQISASASFIAGNTYFVALSHT